MMDQVICTWYRPEEELPEEGVIVVATVSGKVKDAAVKYDRALVTATFYDSCWEVDGVDFDDLTVHAWCDLDAWEEEHL